MDILTETVLHEGLDEGEFGFEFFELGDKVCFDIIDLIFDDFSPGSNIFFNQFIELGFYFCHARVDDFGVLHTDIDQVLQLWRHFVLVFDSFQS